MTAVKCRRQVLAFGFDVVERGNGTVHRGHKQQVGQPFGSNAADALVEGDYSWGTKMI